MEIIKLKSGKKINWYFRQKNGRLYAADTNWTGFSFPHSGEWEVVEKEAAPKWVQKAFENMTK